MNSKEALYRKIMELDPQREIVQIDISHNNVKYNSEIVKLEREVTELTDEEIVRAYLVVNLIKELEYSKKQCVVLEREYKMGRDPSKGARVDILLFKNGDPFAMFELKSPDEYDKEKDNAIKNQLFEVAEKVDARYHTLKYLIYYTVKASESDKLTEEIVTIDYQKYKTYDGWEKAGNPNLMTVPKNYGIVKKPVFTKNKEPDLRTDVTKNELEGIRRNIHNVLWAGGKYHIELFFNLMGILLAKIYDEKETEDGQPYSFQVFYKNGKPEDPEEVAKRVNTLYRSALKKYLGYSEEEVKSRDIIFDAPKVKYVVEALQGISLTTNKYDVLGDFFEKIVRNEFKQSKGQYLTHINLVNFIIRALEMENLALHLINEEERLPYIIDPACGSGTFLIESMKLITSYILGNRDRLKKSQSTKEFTEQMFPPSRPNAWADRFIFGIEINTDLATATKVNMVGHGDGSANIEAKDALIDFGQYSKDLLKVKTASQVYPKPVNEQFDIVISNPPFSVTIDRDTAKGLPEIFIWGEQIWNRLKKGKKEEVSTETLFIERWYQLLKPKGRLGVVLPENVFDTVTDLHVRLFLYKYFWIRAIVSLPDLAFQPYTPTKTSLLFAQKKTPEQVEEWEKSWKKYSYEYSKLKKRIDELFKIKKSDAEYENLKTELVDALKELLEEDFQENDTELDIKELKEKYSDEIKMANEEWWVFKKVSKEQNYQIFMDQAEEIGYKRGLRGEEGRPNDLFQIDDKGNIVIDTKDAKKILDRLRRDVKWEH